MNTLVGPADGDSGQSDQGVAGQNQTPVSSGTAGTTVGTSTGDNRTTTGSAESAPGRRLKNPLANFPTYTYQFTLYMITPDAYDKFVLEGKKDINSAGVNTPDGGAFIIAQSGGINANNRAPQINLDYYIDDVKISTATSGKETQTSTNTTEISFKIIEPYGFSFLSDLQRAQRILQQRSQRAGYKEITNSTKQFFILGVRFLGFNQDGSPITGKEKFNDMGTLPGTSDGQGIFEKFYDILLTELKFSLDGKPVTYQIRAGSIPAETSLSTLKGLVNNATQISGSTVKGTLQNLVEYLNKYQLDLVTQKKITKPNRYAIKWIDNAEELIGSKKLVSDAALDKWRWGGSSANNTAESTDAAGQQSPSASALTKNFAIAPETPIIQTIENVIKNSAYLEDALKILYQAAKPPTGKEGEEVVNKDTNRNIRWYHLSAEFTEADWDPLVNQFAGLTTYVIEVYDTPIIQNVYTNPGVSYYGPCKRYEYWFTGKNSEVISYSQTINTGFFTISLGMTGEESSNIAGGGSANIPVAVDQKPPAETTGRLDRGLAAQNAYITNLFDPGSWASANITIMGDPDFLMSDSTSSVSTIYDKFYQQDGFTIHPNGGQVFIEIYFKEAEDYNYKRILNETDQTVSYKSTDDGLLSVNQSIQFWKYKKGIRELQEKTDTPGVIYQLIEVTSNFNNGKFTQQLRAALVPDFEDNNESDDQREDSAATPETPGPVTGNQTSTGTTTGLKEEPAAPKQEAASQGTSVPAAATQASDDDLAPVTVTAKRINEPAPRISFDGTNWYDENGREVPVDDAGRPLYP